MNEAARAEFVRHWLSVLNRGYRGLTVSRGPSGLVTELILVACDGRIVHVSAPQGMTVEEVSR